jgi:hypothetical protein
VNFDIEPYVGAGPVRLGFSVDEVEESLGQPSIAIDKGGARPTATFPELGVHAHIAADGSCEAIEFMRPATATLDGQPLLGRPFAEVRDWLSGRDPDLATDAAGLTSELLGVGLYAPHAAENPELPAEGAIVFRRDYYRD